jgi:hypothetical protein
MVKAFRVIGISAVFLLLGWTVPVGASQDQQDKPQKQEEHAKPEKQQKAEAPKQQQKANAQKQQGNQQHQQQRQANKQEGQQHQQQQQQARKQQNQQQDHQQQQQQANTQKNQQHQQQQANKQDNQQHQNQHGNRSAQQHSPEQARVQQAAWKSDRASNWQSEHRTWQQRGGYNGYRIPDNRYRAHYGENHGFRIYSLPVMYVGGNRRFQYGGYWFGLVDPWPQYWASNWYENDDVWVDYYDGGYYLCNRRYPNDRIAISFYIH